MKTKAEMVEEMKNLAKKNQLPTGRWICYIEDKQGCLNVFTGDTVDEALEQALDVKELKELME